MPIEFKSGRERVPCQHGLLIDLHPHSCITGRIRNDLIHRTTADGGNAGTAANDVPAVTWWRADPGKSSRKEGRLVQEVLLATSEAIGQFMRTQSTLAAVITWPGHAGGYVAVVHSHRHLDGFSGGQVDRIDEGNEFESGEIPEV